MFTGYEFENYNVIYSFNCCIYNTLLHLINKSFPNSVDTPSTISCGSVKLMLK